jgi:hypothetical protein
MDTFKLALIRCAGKTHRIVLFDSEETPHFGIPRFDYLNFFGFGSGEFDSLYPPAFQTFKVKEVELGTPESLSEAQVYTIQRKLSVNDQYGIFYDGEKIIELESSSTGVPLSHLPAMNWLYYSQLGDRDHAIAIINGIQGYPPLFTEQNHQQLDTIRTILQVI